jgi:hypothetical protein
MTLESSVLEGIRGFKKACQCIGIIFSNQIRGFAHLYYSSVEKGN